jgi:broad specificity phosphatase PhoE
MESRESIRNKGFDVPFCSDLKRAVDSATLMFRDSVNVIQDRRLREVNLGDLTRVDSKKIDSIMVKHIYKPFPKGGGEKDLSFLNDLSKKYPDKNVAIVAHRVPHLALEVLINKKSWEQAVGEDWRLKGPKEWKLGWKYEYEK